MIDEAGTATANLEEEVVSAGADIGDVEPRNPMKFQNSDDSLHEIIEELRKSGKHITMPNEDDFMAAILDADWD
jgi:hypothetical protein